MVSKILTKFIIILSFFNSLVFGFEEQDNRDNEISEEHCVSDMFKPRCTNSEVVIIRKAHYGRINVGKCLTEKEYQSYGSQNNNIKYFGCYKNVMPYLNEKCGLKNECEVRITELEKAFEEDTCQPGLKLHLNVTYSCLKVVRMDERCEISASNDLKYLDPSQISTTKCGPGRKPFSIEAPRGQNIKMTLELFHQLEKNKDEMEENEVMCDRVLGTIKYNTKDNVTICSNGFAQDKESVVKDHFISSSDLVYVSSTHKMPKHNLFLIKIEAIGCRDIIQPEDTWMQRNGDEMVIGCFMTKQKWYLRCQDRSWTGVIGNCSSTIPFSGEIKLDKMKTNTGSKTDIPKKQQLLVIVSICGMGVVACVTIICTGVICLKRYNMKSNKNLPNYYNSAANIQTTMRLEQQPLPQQQLDFINSVQYNRNMQAMQQSVKYNTIHDDHEDGQHLKDEDRYQVLDQEEVAKESLVLV